MADFDPGLTGYRAPAMSEQVSLAEPMRWREVLGQAGEEAAIAAPCVREQQVRISG
ncbi:MAG TPA: hypothetical protein VLL25_09655 [Acidimicrobiales bacterium]|nr:hypothetical protein [Acidimicrobiales bacterium]